MQFGHLMYRPLNIYIRLSMAGLTSTRASPAAISGLSGSTSFWRVPLVAIEIGDAAIVVVADDDDRPS